MIDFICTFFMWILLSATEEIDTEQLRTARDHTSQSPNKTLFQPNKEEQRVSLSSG